MLAVVGDLLEDIVVRIATAAGARHRHAGTDRTTPRRQRSERRRLCRDDWRGACASSAASAPTSSVTGSSGSSRADGVDVRVQRRGRTGSVVVLVGPDGERTMLPDRAAAIELVDVDPAWLDGVTWLHVPSYSLLSEPIGAATRELIDELRRRGGRLSVDVSSVAVVEQFGVERYTSLLDELAPDVVFANEPESRLLPDSGLDR